MLLILICEKHMSRHLPNTSCARERSVCLWISGCRYLYLLSHGSAGSAGGPARMWITGLMPLINQPLWASRAHILLSLCLGVLSGLCSPIMVFDHPYIKFDLVETVRDTEWCSVPQRDAIWLCQIYSGQGWERQENRQADRPERLWWHAEGAFTLQHWELCVEARRVTQTVISSATLLLNNCDRGTEEKKKSAASFQKKPYLAHWHGENVH